MSKNWNSLIKPSKLSYKLLQDKSDLHVARIIAEPLERGFGLTVGNALRRILLSSLRGAAITSIKIPGVLHEFSAINGVKEDLCEIILNLKALAIRMHSVEKKLLRLKAIGPCVVTAKMIEAGSDIEILNHSHVICTLAKGASLEMELTCEMGKGYIPVSPDKSSDESFGVILIDALFNPIRKVAYHVENTRVGQITDYDKLIMDIETNGSITPEMAVALAARILQDQSQLFITFKEEAEERQDKLEELPFNPILLKKVNELDLSVRAQNCLNNDNIVYIGDLVMKEENKMLQTPNFGRKSLNELKQILQGLGLKFGMDIKGWPPENLETLSKKYEDE